MPKRRDAKLLQVLVRQAWENRLVYVILAEDRLVLREASPLRSQTTMSTRARPNALPVAMIIQVKRDVEANRAEAVGLPMQGHVYTSGEVVRS